MNIEYKNLKYVLFPLLLFVLYKMNDEWANKKNICIVIIIIIATTMFMLDKMQNDCKCTIEGYNNYEESEENVDVKDENEEQEQEDPEEQEEQKKNKEKIETNNEKNEIDYDKLLEEGYNEDVVMHMKMNRLNPDILRKNEQLNETLRKKIKKGYKGDEKYYSKEYDPLNTVAASKNMYMKDEKNGKHFTILRPESWMPAYNRPPPCIQNKEDTQCPVFLGDTQYLYNYDTDNDDDETYLIGRGGALNINTKYIDDKLNDKKFKKKEN